MPLRDHFRPPLDDLRSWEGFHGGWPMEIVRALMPRLPKPFIAEPRVHHGAPLEIDVAAYDEHRNGPAITNRGDGGLATWSPSTPTRSIATTLPALDEYEVLVFDPRRGRRLVAAIEIVSPANKDRPSHRRAFVGKCAALLQRRVALSIVDLVTIRKRNLFLELVDHLGEDATGGAVDADLYAVSCRFRETGDDWRFETWEHALALGAPLPELPLWLSDELAVPLELEVSYEETCRVLQIP